ncbi:MAG TPA: hypothetical protein VFU93_09595 [Acidimicrobiales bacterium]|nr:hypothetical protein [Acidimicrobiales bacterium]
MRRRSRRALAGIAAAAVLAGCANGEPARSTNTSATTSTTAAAADLALLAENLLRLHPDPLHHVTRAELDARTIDDPTDPDRLLVAAMRLANLGIGEGHGGVYPWAQQSLQAWPLHLYDFDDGLHVVGGIGAPVGARLVAVGETPVEEVVEAVRPLVPHDNEWTVRSRLPGYLVFPAVLRGLGIDATTLTWELPTGEMTTEAPPATVPSGELAELLGLFQAQVPPTLPYDRDRLFWSERRGDLLYVRWNQVQRADGDTTLAELATAMVDDVTAGAVTRVVIDARHNPGGEIGAATPLVLAVTEIERARPGTVRFLVGRGTFSAASNVIARLAHELNVTVVGEPTGGNQRSYADPRRIDLPASGIVAFVNTRLYDSGDASWGPVQPDIVVAPTRSGDPALDAASH